MEWQRGVNCVKRVAGCHGVHVSRVSFQGERYSTIRYTDHISSKLLKT